MKANLLLLVAATALGLVICEIGLRLFITPESKRLAMYDPDLGWRGRPDGEGVFVRSADNIRTEYRYNRYGFRGEDFAPGKSENTRVLLLGDSFTEALEVDYEKTFPMLLKDSLNRPSSDTIEVLTLASMGYSTAQQLLALRKYRDAARPDVVLLALYTGNDFTENLRRQFAYLDNLGNLRFRPNTDSAAKRGYLKFKRWLYEHSHLVFLVKNFLESATGVRIRDEAKEERDDTNEDYKYRITGLLISTIQDEAVRHGAEFGLLIIPELEELEHGNADTEWLVQFCERQGIRYLNLSDVLRPDYYFEHDRHLNEMGHQAVATAVHTLVSRLAHD